jgi:hypothetical protein
MQTKNRLSEAIVLMIIVTLWTALILAALYFAFGWMEARWGSAAAILTFGFSGGVIVAIAMWIASSRHTTAIYRTALSFAADSQQMASDAQRSLVSVQREIARGDRYQQQAAAQIQVAGYRAALTDARQEVRQAWRAEAPPTAVPVRTWAMATDAADDAGDDFRVTQ